MTYQEYINSPEWEALRALVFERDGHRCLACHSGNYLQGHHIFYPDDFADDKPENVITLCRRHHAYRHDIRGTDPIPISMIIPIVMKKLGQEVSNDG